MGEKVKVAISFTERVTYSGVVEMDRAEFARLDRDLNDRSDRVLIRQTEERIADWLDRQSDFADADDIEIDEFAIHKPKATRA